MNDHRTEAVLVDGSQGEGGGQIVRSALALALVTGRKVVIDKIRAGREKPGLMRQHLTAVEAAAQVAAADVTEARIGSPSLTFVPHQVRPGEYHFSVGTAGSATLVLQTVLPALLIAGEPSSLILEGGTHNQWAPPFDFLQQAFLPLVNRMGPRVTASLDRHGFYPAGDGQLTVHIKPSPTLRGFDLLERGATRHRSVRAIVANLPLHIGQREVDTILRKLNWSADLGRVEQVASRGPGNVVCVELESDHISEVFTGFGRVGVRAEQVALEVVQLVRDYLKSNVPVGPYLADQIMLPLGISAWQTGQQRQRGGTFRTGPLTRHATTHIDVLRQFLGIAVEVESVGGKTQTLVRIGAAAAGH